MKSVIFAAALTGSCAVIYILYRLKLNSRTRRASGSKKPSVNHSDLCTPLKEEKDMATVTEVIPVYTDTSNSSKLLKTENQIVNDKVLIQSSYSENSYIVFNSGINTTDSYSSKTDTNSIEVKSDAVEEVMQISADFNNLNISPVIECTEKSHAELTNNISDQQNSHINFHSSTNNESFINCETVNVNMHSSHTQSDKYIDINPSTITSNFEEEILSSIECKDVNDNTKTLNIKLSHQESDVNNAEKDCEELHCDKQRCTDVLEEAVSNGMPQCTVNDISRCSEITTSDAAQLIDNIILRNSEVTKEDVDEKTVNNMPQCTDNEISVCPEVIKSDVSKEIQVASDTPQLTDNDISQIVSKIVEEDNETSEVVKPKSKNRKKRERRARKLKQLEERKAKEEPCDETQSTNTSSNQSSLPPTTDLCEQTSSKNVSKKEISLENVENVSNDSCISLEKNDTLDKETSSSPDQLCTSDLERENSLSPEQGHITSDCQSLISQASVDSGQGSIEVDHETLYSNLILPESSNSEQYVSHQFEVPQILVGKLIGKKGTFLNKLKSATSANVVLIDHVDNNFKLCVLDGKKWQVSLALDMIRELFPLDQFPDLPLVQVGFSASGPSPQHQPQVNRQILQVDLPPGVVVEVQASAVITTGEVWLQQPLHPTFSALQGLHQCLNINYGDGSSTPILPLPIPANTVCVCQFGGQWCRCQVLDHDHANCTVSLLDVGGYVRLPVTLLRQIRVDYFSLPFQATQCCLFGIQPNNDNGWDEAGRAALQELVKSNIIYATIAAYSQDGLPLVNLYQRQFNQYLFINEKLVDLGHARWMTSRIDFQAA